MKAFADAALALVEDAVFIVAVVNHCRSRYRQIRGLSVFFLFFGRERFFGCICGTVVPQQVDLFVQIGRGDTEVGDAV